ncbi:MAG: hypothetical protein KF893_12265 [Caldilineaceae bacterium]|nr:hypothetical protein [Caldilineaceae bacterium]
MDRPDLDFYFHILRTLETIEIPYVIIGAFAGAEYGITRATYDVDIVVDLTEQKIDALAAAYPSPRYYADPYQMRDSIQMGILFNIVDSSVGRKADLIPLTMKPGYDFALRNRIRRDLVLNESELFQAWFAKPEDVIVGKLMAWNESRSYRHETDIRDILHAMQQGEDAELSASFDIFYIDRWAQWIGNDVVDFWNKLKQAVQFKPFEDL